jgi:hypothetical protein
MCAPDAGVTFIPAKTAQTTIKPIITNAGNRRQSASSTKKNLIFAIGGSLEQEQAISLLRESN